MARSGTLLLALAVLSAPAARAGLPAEATCRLADRYPADSERCRFLEYLEGQFHALRAAAGDKLGAVTLSRQIDENGGNYNAFFDRSGQPTVRLTVAFVDCHYQRPETAVGIIAHELGHRIQQVNGTFSEPNERAGDDYWAPSRRIEAQADRLGEALLRKAGLNAPMAAAFERLAQCAGSAKEYASLHSHPAAVARQVELLKLEADKREAMAKSGQAVDGFLADFRRRSGPKADPLAQETEGLGARGALDVAREPFKITPDLALSRLQKDGRPFGSAETLPRSGSAVILPGNRWWVPPLSDASAEDLLIHFATSRDPRALPPGGSAALLPQALRYIEANDLWGALPGFLHEGPITRARTDINTAPPPAP